MFKAILNGKTRNSIGLFPTLNEAQIWISDQINTRSFGSNEECLSEIVDLSNDYDFLLEQCYNNRIKEYGSIQDQLDEIYHDIDAWRSRIGGVKTKHPKPVRP